MIRRIYFSLFVCLLFFQVRVSSQAIKVTLLGTGAPQPSIERFGAATLVEAGGTYFLFDCGRGATQRSRTQKFFTGQVTVGEDLMVIEIGETVEIKQPKKEK